MTDGNYSAAVTAASSHRLARWARATDLPLLAAAAAFIVVLLVPLYAEHLTVDERTALHAVDALLWAVFAIDYSIRVTLSLRRWEYVKSHVPDLLMLVVPVLRPLRLLRVLGLLGSASRRASERRLAAVTAYVITGVLVLIVVAAGFALDAERHVPGANITTAGDALWWAATTVSTVGYGDRYPVTAEGRTVAVLLMVGGVALLGVITASVAAWFVSRFSELEAAEQRVDAVTTAALTDVIARLERIERALDQRPS